MILRLVGHEVCHLIISCYSSSQVILFYSCVLSSYLIMSLSCLFISCALLHVASLGGDESHDRRDVR